MKEKRKIASLPGVYLKNRNGDIEYKIVELKEDDCEKIFICAVGSSWSDHIKDTVLFKLTNTGNGIKIGKKYLAQLTSDEGNTMGYDVSEYMRILLNYIDATSHIQCTYTVVVDTEVVI